MGRYYVFAPRPALSEGVKLTGTTDNGHHPLCKALCAPAWLCPTMSDKITALPIPSERFGEARPLLSAVAAIGTLGGLIGLGGAEFRLPLLISYFRFRGLEAVILNKSQIRNALKDHCGVAGRDRWRAVVRARH